MINHAIAFGPGPVDIVLGLCIKKATVESAVVDDFLRIGGIPAKRGKEELRVGIKVCTNSAQRRLVVDEIENRRIFGHALVVCVIFVARIAQLSKHAVFGTCGGRALHFPNRLGGNGGVGHTHGSSIIEARVKQQRLALLYSALKRSKREVVAGHEYCGLGAPSRGVVVRHTIAAVNHDSRQRLWALLRFLLVTASSACDGRDGRNQPYHEQRQQSLVSVTRQFTATLRIDTARGLRGHGHGQCGGVARHLPPSLLSPISTLKVARG